jgi:hypothetical protein
MDSTIRLRHFVKNVVPLGQTAVAGDVRRILLRQLAVRAWSSRRRPIPINEAQNHVGIEFGACRDSTVSRRLTGLRRGLPRFSAGMAAADAG